MSMHLVEETPARKRLSAVHSTNTASPWTSGTRMIACCALSVTSARTRIRRKTAYTRSERAKHRSGAFRVLMSSSRHAPYGRC